MRRRAVWKPRREDARLARTLGALRMGTFGILVLAVTVAFVGWERDLGALAFGFLFALVGLAPRPVAFRERHGAALAEVAPWPLPTGTFPARVFYWQGIDRVGEDEAMVSFGDGWMTVEGVRASFSLRAGDVHVRYAEGPGGDLLFPRGERVEVRPFDALSAAGESARGLLNRFGLALSRWAEDGAGPSANLVVLPPLRGSPRSSERRTALTAAVGGAFVWAGWLHLLDAPSLWGYLAYEATFAFGVGALLSAALRLRLHARDRRRTPPKLR